MPTVLESV